MMMFATLHEAGLKSLYWWCDKCPSLHHIPDDEIKKMRFAALSMAEGVMPQHKTVQ
jgi:hypothetical protein